MDTPKIERAMVAILEDGFTEFVDVVIWKGAPWLVPKWLEPLGRPVRVPARLIPMARLQHQHKPLNPKNPARDVAWFVNEPVPRSLLADPPPPELSARFGVVERPPIEVPLNHGNN